MESDSEIKKGKSGDEKKQGVILSYVTLLVQMLLQLGFTPIMLRLLGQSDYGLYSLAKSTISYLNIFSLGFGGAYIRFYSRYAVRDDKEGISSLNKTYFFLFSVLGMVAVLAGLVLIQNIDVLFKELTPQETGRARILFLLLLFNLAFHFPFTVFSSFITANSKFVFPKIVELARVISSPLVSLPVLLLGYGSVGYVGVSVSIYFVTYIVNIYFAIKKLGMSFSGGHIRFSLIKELGSFSFFIFIFLISEQIDTNIDSTLLGYFTGATAVAVYGVATTIPNVVTSFSRSISAVFVPQIQLLVAERIDTKTLTDLMIRIGRIQLFIVGLLISGFIVFGQPFISLWAGSGYESAYSATVILLLSSVIWNVQRIGLEVQKALNLHMYTDFVFIGASLINLFISIPLVKSFGVIGAALGTMIASIIGKGVVNNIVFKFVSKLDMGRFWKSIIRCFPGFLIPFAFGILIFNKIVLVSWGDLCIWVPIYSIIYCVSIFFFGMNKFERDLIVRPLKVFLKVHAKREDDI